MAAPNVECKFTVAGAVTKVVFNGRDITGRVVGDRGDVADTKVVRFKTETSGQ